MDTNRRRLLQALTASGVALTARAVPERWTQPLVQAVVVPTHAQATGEEFADSVSVLLELADAQPMPETSPLLARTLRGAMNLGVPRAHALLTDSFPTDVCVRRQAGDTFDVRVILYDNSFTDDPHNVFEKSGVPLGVVTDIPQIREFCPPSRTCKVRVISINGTADGEVSISGSVSTPFFATPGAWPPVPEDGCLE